MFKPKDKVKVKRDIYRWSFVTGKGYRQEVLYSKKDETGEVVEVFYAATSSEPKKPYAKVLIEGQIKTFRLSSIEKL